MTLIFYAPPHSLAAVLADMADTLGAERQCVIAREVTKVAPAPSLHACTGTLSLQGLLSARVAADADA